MSFRRGLCDTREDMWYTNPIVVCSAIGLGFSMFYVLVLSFL